MTRKGRVVYWVMNCLGNIVCSIHLYMRHLPYLQRLSKVMEDDTFNIFDLSVTWARFVKYILIELEWTRWPSREQPWLFQSRDGHDTVSWQLAWTCWNGRSIIFQAHTCDICIQSKWSGISYESWKGTINIIISGLDGNGHKQQHLSLSKEHIQFYVSFILMERTWHHIALHVQ